MEGQGSCALYGTAQTSFVCPNAAREWEEKLEKLEGVFLPLQEQLHDLGTAVHCWEKTGKIGIFLWVCGVVFLQ